MKALVAYTQRVLSRSRLAVALAMKLMNQCRMVVGQQLTPSCNPEENGEKAVLEALAPRIRTFVDVGANAGHWTSALTSAAGRQAGIRGLLAEANEVLAGALRAKFADMPSIAVEACAVGAEPGTASFYISQSCSEHSSLYAETAADRSVAMVRIETVDRLMVKHGFERLDFLKIDTEGADFEVMLGCKDALARGAIDVIQFEYGSGWKVAGHTLTRAMRFLQERGYSCHLITPRGLEAYDFNRYGEAFLYANFLALSGNAKQWAGSVLPGLGRKQLSYCKT